jgi:hypothetical protein
MGPDESEPVLDSDEEGQPLADDDDVAAAAFAALEEQRLEWLGPALHEPTDFKVTILGGVWTQRNKGVAYGAVRGAAVREESLEAWLQSNGFPKSARFDVSLYGDKNACAMARAWCHRMQFFRDLVVTGDDPTYQYDDGVIAGYTEPSDFREMVPLLRGRQLARAEQIRALRPR